jgi:hypothetical protein
MSVRDRFPTCDLIGRLFLGSGLQRMLKILNHILYSLFLGSGLQINTFFAIHVNMMENVLGDCKFCEALL